MQPVFCYFRNFYERGLQMSCRPTNIMRKKLNLWVLSFVLIFAAYIIVKLFGTSVTDSARYQAMANDNQFRSTSVRANRGSIYDSNGKILAQSATVYSIIINPYRLSKLNNETINEETGKTEYQRQLDCVISILTDELDNVTAEEITEKFKKSDSKWACVAKSVEKPVADKILTRLDEDKHQEMNLSRYMEEMAYAYGSATVPMVNVIVGKAYGSAYAVMNSRALGADLVFAWPESSIGMMNVESAVKIIYDDEINASKEAPKLIREKAAEYEAAQSSPQAAASRGYVDAIIEPSATRKHVIAAFEMLYTKRVAAPAKKHGTV